MRKLTGYAGLVVGVVGVVMSLYHVYARLTPAAPDGLVLRIIALAFCLVLAFLLFPVRTSGPARRGRHAAGDAAPVERHRRIPWIDLGLAGLSLAGLSYLFIYYDYITERFPTAHPLSAMDIAVGTVDGRCSCWRRPDARSAWPCRCWRSASSPTAWPAPGCPGLLRHKGLTYEILIDQTFFTTEGLFGIPLGVAASYVILFIIFGAFLEKSGAGQFFMNLANAMAGGQRGGPGKVAVVSSSLFGTISGSAVANVMVDGWLTIPMMKRTGFKPEAAAAVEAVASTGGQIMPPVMGAASFVMAEFLGVPYSHIMMAAAIPAIFYYGALFAAIHFNASRNGLRGIPKAELPSLRGVLREHGHLLAPLLAIFCLLLSGFTATYAAIVSTAVVIYAWLLGPRIWWFVAVGAVFWWIEVPGPAWAALAVAGLVAVLVRPGGGGQVRRLVLKDGPAALRDGAQQTVPVAMATATAGIMIGIILQTGMAIRFTSFLVEFAGGNLFMALVITMIAAIILGTALPTTPAYIMLAALLIPALIKLGVPPLAAHMFAFYFGCLSAITPPECLAVYAAASISRCGVWAAGWQAVKFASAGFIVPFFFVYYPALLFQGPWTRDRPGRVDRRRRRGRRSRPAWRATSSGRATWLERGLFVAAALLLIDPGLVTDLIGAALLGGALMMQRLRPAAVPADPRFL